MRIKKKTGTMGIAADRFLNLLQQSFAEQTDPDNAFFMAKYMKNQFPFFGIKTPERKAISKACIQQAEPFDFEDLKYICRACFQKPERERQYAVNDLMRNRIRKLDESFLELFHELIPQRSWWDTVDFLAPKLAGRLLLFFPEKMEEWSEKWITSDNIWYQRSAILFQLDYKEQTRPALLFQNILRQAGSGEFFVQKAAGWALRQYSKVNPGEVRQFIQAHTLPALTVREGSTYLTP